MERIYSTKCKGTGGQIKRRYTDFIVEEVRRDGTVRLEDTGGRKTKTDRDLASPLLAEEYVVAPFAISQDLASIFGAEDRVFTVFGATEQGELVC